MSAQIASALAEGGDDGGGASATYAVGRGRPRGCPSPEEHPVWRAALDALAQVLTIENVNAWLTSTRVIGQEREVLRVAVPKEFNKPDYSGTTR